MSEDNVSEFDVIVIGAGPAGENAADHAIRGSDRTAALVEAELVGGECSYWACMPSKALLRPLDVLGAARHLQGIRGPLEVDPEGLLARRDTWTSGYDDSGQVRWAEGAGIEVVRGRGRLAGERTVEVTAADGSTRTLRARQAVVLATGSVPVVPLPLREARPWGSRDVTGVHEVPDRLAVVGGGVVACEAARWMAALGSEVTLLVRGDGVLPRAEAFVSDLVVAGLEADGVRVRLSTATTAATREEVRDTGTGHVHGGPVTLTLQGPDEAEELVVDELLVATGRRPTTDDLGLDSVGVAVEDLAGRTHGGPLPDWLLTVGDVNGVAPLTHWGKHQARLVGALLAARAEGRPDPAPPATVVVTPVPQVVFTDPQVAWVGPTAAEARELGLDVETRDAPYTSASGASLLRDDADGKARLVVERGTGRLVGATFVGPDTAELLHAATVAVTAGLDLATLAHAVPSYPTASEIWLRLLEAEPGQEG